MPAVRHPLVLLVYDLACLHHGPRKRRDGVTSELTHIDTAMAFGPKDAVSQAVLAAHDLVEDGLMTLAQLAAAVADFEEGAEVVDGVDTLTRRPGETYPEFAARVRRHREGKWVSCKVADVLSNLVDNPTPRQREKYREGLTILLS